MIVDVAAGEGYGMKQTLICDICVAFKSECEMHASLLQHLLLSTNTQISVRDTWTCTARSKYWKVLEKKWAIYAKAAEQYKKFLQKNTPITKSEIRTFLDPKFMFKLKY